MSLTTLITKVDKGSESKSQGLTATRRKYGRLVELSLAKMRLDDVFVKTLDRVSGRMSRLRMLFGKWSARI